MLVTAVQANDLWGCSVHNLRKLRKKGRVKAELEPLEGKGGGKGRRGYLFDYESLCNYFGKPEKELKNPNPSSPPSSVSEKEEEQNPLGMDKNEAERRIKVEDALKKEWERKLREGDLVDLSTLEEDFETVFSSFLSGIREEIDLFGFDYSIPCDVVLKMQRRIETKIQKVWDRIKDVTNEHVESVTENN